MFGCEDFEILPNGIRTDKYAFDADRRKDIRQLLKVTDDATVLGFVGRLESQKNPLYLVDILSAVKKLKDNVKLVVVGDGTLKEAMSEHAKLKGVADDVIFAGIQKDPSAWYSAFDAFLLPSLYEGLPIAAIEAQASGLPCFISDAVTKEVSLTDNVHYCKLTDSADNWASEIHAHLHDNGDRIKYADVIKHSDYSIERAARKLKRIYDKTNGEL